MREDEVNKKVSELEERGYRKWTVAKSHEHTAYEMMKSFDGDVISFRVWDWTKYNQSDDQAYEMDICFIMGHDVRIDITLTNCHKSIEEIEDLFHKYREVY